MPTSQAQYDPGFSAVRNPPALQVVSSQTAMPTYFLNCGLKSLQMTIDIMHPYGVPALTSPPLVGVVYYYTRIPVALEYLYELQRQSSSNGNRGEIRSY